MSDVTELKATFTQSRSTPGTHVFKEEVADVEISGSFYLKKAASKLINDPKKVEVIIRPAV